MPHNTLGPLGEQVKTRASLNDAIFKCCMEYSSNSLPSKSVHVSTSRRADVKIKKCAGKNMKKVKRDLARYPVIDNTAIRPNEPKIHLGRVQDSCWIRSRAGIPVLLGAFVSSQLNLQLVKILPIPSPLAIYCAVSSANCYLLRRLELRRASGLVQRFWLQWNSHHYLGKDLRKDVPETIVVKSSTQCRCGISFSGYSWTYLLSFDDVSPSLFEAGFSTITRWG